MTILSSADAESVTADIPQYSQDLTLADLQPYPAFYNVVPKSHLHSGRSPVL